MTEAIRVLILDDHPVILDGLASYLEAQGEFKIVARCDGSDEALVRMRESSPEIAIVDVKVKGGFSFDFVDKALIERPGMKFVFITGHDDDLFIEKAFQSGALGYVLKSEPLSEVVAAARAAVRGERYLSPEVQGRVTLEGGEKDGVKTRLSLLTRREREVLHYVSQGRSAKEISEILKISTWTVTNHKANIMAKLDIHNQVGLTRFAVETGIADLNM